MKHARRQHHLLQMQLDLRCGLENRDRMMLVLMPPLMVLSPQIHQPQACWTHFCLPLAAGTVCIFRFTPDDLVTPSTDLHSPFPAPSGPRVSFVASMRHQGSVVGATWCRRPGQDPCAVSCDSSNIYVWKMNGVLQQTIHVTLPSDDVVVVGFCSDCFVTCSGGMCSVSPAPNDTSSSCSTTTLTTAPPPPP